MLLICKFHTYMTYSLQYSWWNRDHSCTWFLIDKCIWWLFMLFVQLLVRMKSDLADKDSKQTDDIIIPKNNFHHVLNRKLIITLIFVLGESKRESNIIWYTKPGDMFWYHAIRRISVLKSKYMYNHNLSSFGTCPFLSIYYFYWLWKCRFVYVTNLLVHLTYRVIWAVATTGRPSSVNFWHFHPLCQFWPKFSGMVLVPFQSCQTTVL